MQNIRVAQYKPFQLSLPLQPEPMVVFPIMSSRECSETSSISVFQNECTFSSTPGSSVLPWSHSPLDLHVTVNIALASWIDMLKSEN